MFTHPTLWLKHAHLPSGCSMIVLQQIRPQCGDVCSEFVLTTISYNRDVCIRQRKMRDCDSVVFATLTPIIFRISETESSNTMQHGIKEESVSS